MTRVCGDCLCFNAIGDGLSGLCYDPKEAPNFMEVSDLDTWVVPRFDKVCASGAFIPKSRGLTKVLRKFKLRLKCRTATSIAV